MYTRASYANAAVEAPEYRTNPESILTDLKEDEPKWITSQPICEWGATNIFQIKNINNHIYVIEMAYIYFFHASTYFIS